LLEANTESDLLHLMHTYLSREVEVLEIRSKIANQAQEELGKAQRDYILREQMKQIQKELGESEPEQAEAVLLRERIEKAGLPEEVRAEADRELKRLERLSSRSASARTSSGRPAFSIRSRSSTASACSGSLSPSSFWICFICSRRM